MLKTCLWRITSLAASLAIVCLVFVSAPVAAESQPSEAEHGAVLVTGASSGWQASMRAMPEPGQ